MTNYNELSTSNYTLVYEIVPNLTNNINEIKVNTFGIKGQTTAKLMNELFEIKNSKKFFEYTQIKPFECIEFYNKYKYHITSHLSTALKKLTDPKILHELPAYGLSYTALTIYLSLVIKTIESLHNLDNMVVMIASLYRDIGNLAAETKLQKLNDRSTHSAVNEHGIKLHAIFSAQAAFKFFNDLRASIDIDENDKVYKALTIRTVMAVLYHSGGNAPKDTALEAVRVACRLAGVGGINQFYRNLLMDVVTNGLPVFPELGYYEGLVKFTDPKASHMLFNENIMRNIHSTSLINTQKLIDTAQIECGIIQQFMTGKLNLQKNQRLVSNSGSLIYSKSFEPEIEVYEKHKEYRGTKRILPKHIWQAVKAGPNHEVISKMIELDKSRPPLSKVITQLLYLYEPYISKNLLQRTLDICNKLNENQSELYRQTSLYVISQKLINLEEEKKKLELLSNSEELITQFIAKWLIENPIWNPNINFS